MTVITLGAFNSPRVIEQMLDTLLQHGDVLYVEYAIGDFDMGECVTEIQDILFGRTYYSRYVLFGMSMGFIGTLRLYTQSRDFMKPHNTVIIGADAAQCRQHLPRMARIIKYVPDGPLFGMLFSSLATWFMFPSRKMIGARRA